MLALTQESNIGLPIPLIDETVHSNSFDSQLSDLPSRSSDSLNVRFIGNWPFGWAHASESDPSRNLAFCGAGGGVYLLDVSNKYEPVIVSEGIHTRGSIVDDMFYDQSSQMLYIAAAEAGIEVWDLGDVQNPAKIGSCEVPASASRITVSNGYAYVISMAG